MAAARAVPIADGFYCTQCEGDAAEKLWGSARALNTHVHFVHNTSKAQRRAIVKRRLETMESHRVEREEAERAADAAAKPKRGHKPKAAVIFDLQPTPTATLTRPPAPATPTYNEPSLRDAISYLEGKHRIMGDTIQELRELLRVAQQHNQ